MVKKKKEKEKQDVQTGDTPEEEMFGNVNEDNDLGITEVEVASEESEEQISDEKKPKDDEEVKQEEGKETEEPEPDKKAEEKREEQEEADELLEKIKQVSPEMAELIEKKGFNTVKDVFKSYEEIEKSYTQKSQKASNLIELVKDLYELDDDGNVVGYTEKGKEVILGQKKSAGEDAEPHEKKRVEPSLDDKDKGLNIPNDEKTKEQFFSQFEDNPIETVTKIAIAAMQYLYGGQLKQLQEKLQPIFTEREEMQRLKLVDEVAEEAVERGDTIARQFFETYAGEIAEELKKMDSEFKRKNPKLCIQQAYEKVKLKKYEGLEKKLKEKYGKEREETKDKTDTGGSSGGGGDRKVDPIIKEMKDTVESQPDSVFFSV